MSKTPSRRRPDAMQSTQLLRSVIESAPTALVMVDAEGRIVLVNTEAEKVFGYSRDELIDRPVERLVPERFCAWHPRLRYGFFARPETRRMGAGRELYGLRKDGSEFPVEIGLNPIVTEEGLLVLSAIVDITQRKRLEARFRAMIESAPTAMVMIDLAGTIVLVNAETEKLFGYQRDELLGNAVEVLLPEALRSRHPELRKAFFDRPEARRTGEGRDLFALRKDGSEFPVEIGLNPVQTDEGTFVLSAVVDITERKRLEGAQRELNEELEQRVAGRTAELEIARDAAQSANRAKSQFLANMSHEIRTPLNAVIGLTEVVLRTELTETQIDHLLTVMDSAESLLTLINDVLDFSKVEAGKLHLEHVRFNLHEVVSDTLRALALRAQQKGIELACFIAPELPSAMIGDPGRLRQVISNLVSNAIKFTHQGEVALRVDLEASSGGLLLLFSVRDTGIGIEPTQLDRLFDPFEQVDASTTRRYGGSGLGLSICRQLVELMGGQIGAESTPGEGSTFHFTARFELPDDAPDISFDSLEGAYVSIGGDPRAAHGASRESLARNRRARRPEKRRELDIPPQRVLLVEDSLANCKVALAILDEHRHTTVVAENGRQALRRLATHQFDVVLMDVQMPEMDGFEATRAIRAAEAGTHRHMPIIAMTAHALQGDREKCLAVGMDDYVVKPIRREDLFRALARAVGAHDAGRPVQADPAPRVKLPRQTAAIDWSGPLAQVDGKHDVLCDIVEAYLSEIHENLERLPDLVASGAATEIRRCAHTLKGAMRMFDAKEAYQLAQELELLAGTTRLAGGAEIFGRLKQAVEQILLELSRFVESGGSLE